jgi:hypothetical protein
MTMSRMTRAGAVALAAMVLGLASAAAAHEPVSPSLPLGDGKVTDHPKAGNVFACRTEFRQGRRHDGPWFHGETWNPLEKPHVSGEVMWPQARFSMTEKGADIAVDTNGLPVGQPTGTFPISPDEAVYQYDTNPNGIAAIDLDFAIPVSPRRAASGGCLPMGMIGFSITGVAFYNALDDAGRDAAAHEIQDLCDGHPQGKGQYHYHSGSVCLPGLDTDAVVGWALDGYPILGRRDAEGKLLTNADLDDCHGRAEQVLVDDRTYDYAYRLTREYPYVMGCFTGEVPDATRQSIRESMGPPRRR